MYLADSIRHLPRQPRLGIGGEPAEGVELNKREILLPEKAMANPRLLDSAIRVADSFAKAHANETTVTFAAFENYLAQRDPELAHNSNVASMLFDLSQTLLEFIKKPEDTIWAYVLRNQYKPTFLRKGFDVLLGNPPWLSFRFVEKGKYQDYLKHLIVKECRLLEGAGHLVPHLELGTLFFVRCSDLYLRPKGKIGFVLPRSIFTADQHDHFRRSDTRSNTTLTEVWDLDEVSPLFEVPAAVAFADLVSPRTEVLAGQTFSGQLRRKNASMQEARQQLQIRKAEVHIVKQGARSYLSTNKEKISRARSYYQPFFKEGATIVPRNFWFVEFRPQPQLGIDPRRPFVATDPRAEEEAKEPYKGSHVEGPVESEFLYATLLSTDLLPFGQFGYRPVVLPVTEDAHGFHLLTVALARDKGFLGLADWLTKTQEAWVSRRKEKAKRGDAISWLNYRNKLTDQNPSAKYVVLYPKSATFLCAATIPLRELRQTVGQQQITLRRFVADYVTYYFETESRDEARYLTAVLNAPCVDTLIKPMQARGLWGPRDIVKKVWELPIPQFQATKGSHLRLAEITAACEEKVRATGPALQQQSIGRARSAIRESLKEELGEIDALVQPLLK